MKHVESIPYLGVRFYYKLKWNNYVNINNIKINRRLGFIHRNLNQCPKQAKAQEYITLLLDPLSKIHTSLESIKKRKQNSSPLTTGV